MQFTLTIPKSDPLRFTPPWGAVVTLRTDGLPAFDYMAAKESETETDAVLVFPSVQAGQVIAYGVRNKRDPSRSLIKHCAAVPDGKGSVRLVEVGQHYLTLLNHVATSAPARDGRAAGYIAPAGDNILADMRCPSCFASKQFDIEVTTWWRAEDDGMWHEDGNLDYDADARCECVFCGYRATVGTFRYVSAAPGVLPALATTLTA